MLSDFFFYLLVKPIFVAVLSRRFWLKAQSDFGRLVLWKSWMVSEIIVMLHEKNCTSTCLQGVFIVCRD